ncbi:rab9 effector protein with kelch motifs isoform X1 [Corythoichthys intestinalis]|uniref:rab9 effector protein with kelch motifs isoform X1 n=1 Tax=Corythoichthys intestinalis TaxID=161448 RepID=UPI0025A5586B|nr:rab9 effector protein with kelch motifs isoform X1 [Corythoichthys intestinalis]
MGMLNFYVIWSLSDAPRQFSSKSNRKCFHVHVPLPLPNQLVIFGIGEWAGDETAISAEVVVGPDVRPQNIGTLTSRARCLTFEGGWSPDIEAVSAHRGRRGVHGKIVLTVCGQLQDQRSILSSSIPQIPRKCLFPEQFSTTNLSCTSLPNIAEGTVTLNSSQFGGSVCYSDIQVKKVDIEKKLSLWPTEQTPKRTVISKMGFLTWRSEDMDDHFEGNDRSSTPKKMRLARMNSQEEMAEQIKTADREVSVCPSERWSHTMCLSDPGTAILIGGETSHQTCKDSLWKLELDNDFWYPMCSSTCGPSPPCARGHSVTYDPESNTILVYGGLREGQRFCELYILNTLTWKWKLVTAKGNVPSLAYHSAAFYKKELFVFGGIHPSQSSEEKVCSNALYIFNPEFQLWYKPIVEGDKPLPRFGHSATLLSHKLIIFGGRKTATYLNDLHILDLGLMEYTAVKSGNMPPLPRGFHAALPVSDNKILVSGGCSAIGALQDVHVFNTDTNMWSSVTSSKLSAKPRAGHSVIDLTSSTTLADSQRRGRDELVKVQCTLLVFGGSDCSGTFYNDTIKCTIEIPV